MSIYKQIWPSNSTLANKLVLCVLLPFEWPFRNLRSMIRTAPWHWVYSKYVGYSPTSAG